MEVLDLEQLQSIMHNLWAPTPVNAAAMPTRSSMAYLLHVLRHFREELQQALHIIPMQDIRVGVSCGANRG